MVHANRIITAVSARHEAGKSKGLGCDETLSSFIIYACLRTSALDWRMAEQNSGRGVDASNYQPPYTRSMVADELGHTPTRTGAKKTHVIYSRQSSHHGSSLLWPLTLKYIQTEFFSSGCGDLFYFISY